MWSTILTWLISFGRFSYVGWGGGGDLPDFTSIATFPFRVLLGTLVAALSYTHEVLGSRYRNLNNGRGDGLEPIQAPLTRGFIIFFF